jgi:hypothetical protein
MPPKEVSTTSLSDCEMELLRNYLSCMKSKSAVGSDRYMHRK